MLRLSHLVPYRYIPEAAQCLTILETMVVVALLLPWTRWIAVRAAMVLSASFVGYSVLRASKGIRSPCGCFGSLYAMSARHEFGLAVTMAAICVYLMYFYSQPKLIGWSSRRAQ